MLVAKSERKAIGLMSASACKYDDGNESHRYLRNAWVIPLVSKDVGKVLLPVLVLGGVQSSSGFGIVQENTSVHDVSCIGGVWDVVVLHIIINGR